ncbi:MAG: hypothetical protein NUV82_03045 [Candidatus Komeilibacteria bacterium]|nr:hypothetical protein [Candidatus Komeilibacteria bacterium]
MNFRLLGPWNYTPERILREAGYHQHRDSFVKLVGRDYYPRWHIYVKQESDNQLLFSIHLDQRAAVHEGIKAHGADYDGPLVKTEADRVLGLFEKQRHR